MPSQVILEQVLNSPVNGLSVSFVLMFLVFIEFDFQGAHHVYNPRDRQKYPNDELYRAFPSLSLLRNKLIWGLVL